MWTARQTDSVVSPASLLPDTLSDEEQDFQTAEDNPRKRQVGHSALYSGFFL